MKNQIEAYLQNELHEIEGGNISPMDLALFLTDVNKLCEQYREWVMPYVLKEIKRYPTGDYFKKNGRKITIMQTGRYDYKHDQVWQEKTADVKSREVQMKLKYHLINKQFNFKDKLAEPIMDGKGKLIRLTDFIDKDNNFIQEKMPDNIFDKNGDEIPPAIYNPSKETFKVESV